MNPEISGFGCVGFFIFRRDVSQRPYAGSFEDISNSERSFAMLWTLALILLVLWMLGLVTSHAAGGLIHILLVVAIVVVIVRLLQGRRPLT